MKRSYIREILEATNEKTISFAGGLPDESLFPLEKIQKATAKVLENPKALQYSKSQGDENLREKIAKLYTEKFDFPTSKDEILITTGSQQAFDIISKLFIKDEVVVQTPSYIGAINSFKVLGLKVRGVKEIASLNIKLKKGNCFYCMSDFANPNTINYSEENRREIVHILKKKESFFIEDGAYSLLDFEGKIKKPISAFYNRSFHLGSFSKIVAPGLRVGWIRANKKLIDRVLVAKEALDLHTSTLNQMIINQYLEENSLDEHLDCIRNSYYKKMDFMARCFEEYIPSFKFERPNGGMFIYGSFEEESLQLAKKALEKNVAFVPAQVFFHDERKSKEARFNFTNSSYDDIEKGIKRVAQLLFEKKEAIWLRILKEKIA